MVTISGECQFYMDVDCSSITYDTPASAGVLGAVSRAQASSLNLCQNLMPGCDGLWNMCNRNKLCLNKNCVMHRPPNKLVATLWMPPLLAAQRQCRSTSPYDISHNMCIVHSHLMMGERKKIPPVILRRASRTVCLDMSTQKPPQKQNWRRLSAGKLWSFMVSPHKKWSASPTKMIKNEKR